MPGPHILLVVGDPSADEHAAALVKALKAKAPELRISALGGERLKALADRFIFPLVGVGGFGFLEPLLKIPALWNVKRRIERLFQEDRPDLVIPIDYYGFNIHVAEAAKARGIPVVYYVSPQVWASRPGRIARLGRAVQRMLVIFPFEEPLYRDAGVPVTYVGHPLVERLPPPQEPSSAIKIGLLPGSRRGVVRTHVPILAHTADRLHARFPAAEVYLFRPLELSAAFYEEALASRPWLQLVHDPSYDLRRQMTLTIGVSGTAALENTLLGIPMVIMYRLSTVTYWIAKRLITIPFVGIPNILAGRAIVPECLQAAANPDALAAQAGDLLADPAKREAMRQDLLALRSKLETGGSARAADEILSLLPAATPA